MAQQYRCQFITRADSRKLRRGVERQRRIKAKKGKQCIEKVTKKIRLKGVRNDAKLILLPHETNAEITYL